MYSCYLYFAGMSLSSVSDGTKTARRVAVALLPREGNKDPGGYVVASSRD